MTEGFCRFRLDGVRQLAEAHRTTLFSLCLLSFVFSPVAAFGNILAIQALRKTSFLPPNLKKLFLSLSLSDLAVGMFSQLTLAVVFKMALTKNFNLDVLCPLTLTVFYLTVYLLSSVSFMNVTAIAVDRLLAVSLHLRYQELVTSKRVMIALAAIWLSSCLTVTSLGSYISVVFGSMGYVLTTAAYLRVYKVARYHQNQIQNQFQLQSSQAVVLLRERKSALNVVYIYIIYIACYLPSLLLINDLWI